ncbi:hypothetical protein [Niveispirillum irakense]|uniref:hypothetical protein n=1 Tax=Niveispirillum irakense TaxID=34011 RepID=UPI00040FF1BF|nr:hypothetical protein [Niveispirillum irakense]
MERRLLCETTLQGLRPAGAGGGRVIETWEQLDQYIRRNLGDAAADLLAEPVMGHGAQISWFGPAGGNVVPFRDLDDTARADLLARLQETVAQIRDQADRLSTAGTGPTHAMGEALSKALKLPPPVEDQLFSVGGRPVLINWGIELEGPPPEREPLAEFLRAVPPPLDETSASDPPSPPDEPADTEPADAAERQPVVSLPLEAVPVLVVHGTGWGWLWLLLLPLLALIFYLLLAGCALRPWLPGYCPVPASAVTQQEEQQENLLAELAQLEQRLAQAPRCAPAEPALPPPEPSSPAPAPPPPSQAQDAEFDRRMEEAGAKEGDLTITLIWDTTSDLDLYVICPDGTEIDFRRKTACGGQLDVDANVRDPVPNPVENVYFAGDAWQPGNYAVRVANAKRRGSSTDRFEVRVKKGEDVQIYQGTVNDQQVVDVTVVTMP